jgi:hypothetical protein
MNERILVKVFSQKDVLGMLIDRVERNTAECK